MHAQPQPTVGGSSVWQLSLAHAGWWLVSGVAVATSVYGFWEGFRRPELLGPDVVLFALDQAGIPLRIAIAIGLAGPFVAVATIAFVIYLRRPRDPMALYTSVALVTFVSVATKASAIAMVTRPGLEPLVRAVHVVGLANILILAALFPSGARVPRWGPIVGLVAVVPLAMIEELPLTVARFPERPAAMGEGLGVALLMGWVISYVVAAAMQGHRYRTSSSTLERQQMKWAMFPIGLLLVHSSSVVFLELLADPGPAWSGWAQLSIVPTALLMPVGLAAAVLRHRLYDIDRLISRTASYAVITVTLVGLYVGLVLVLRGLLPRQNELAIVGSTLAVAAAFNPLRRRVQDLVDRRFNRTRYDAERALQQSARRLQGITEPETVVREVASMTRRIFDPEQVSVWVRTSRRSQSP